MTGKGGISVGDDTGTGEPVDAPEGPYITARTDNEKRSPGKNLAHEPDAGAQLEEQPSQKPTRP